MKPPEEFWYLVGMALFVFAMLAGFALMSWAGVDVQ